MHDHASFKSYKNCLHCGNMKTYHYSTEFTGNIFILNCTFISFLLPRTVTLLSDFRYVGVPVSRKIQNLLWILNGYITVVVCCNVASNMLHCTCFNNFARVANHYAVEAIRGHSKSAFAQNCSFLTSPFFPLSVLTFVANLPFLCTISSFCTLSSLLKLRES